MISPARHLLGVGQCLDQGPLYIPSTHIRDPTNLAPANGKIAKLSSQGLICPDWAHLTTIQMAGAYHVGLLNMANSYSSATRRMGAAEILDFVFP